ncbi:YcnI family protein [Rhodopseudomonas sp. HC1]|uniref:YcnI family protein n=1 Tax=Rhodopseudomonas infernalis TaxID=2897386 RepID=UPI001EE81C78|nr:YcnI family protein [Rhodopseudomonas infernalis]MCG6206912.1 YcnI family protein [Rhodopseudomonas infernalis]
MRAHVAWSAAACVAAALGATPSLAHVSLQPSEAVAGNYFQTALSVPHGCDGAATVAVRVKIPDGVLSVKPQMKPGWTVEIKTRKIEGEQPKMHGKTISETVDEVSWRGGPLPDNLYDTFGLVMKLPDAAGKTLYFPVVQECEKGVHRWIELPAAKQAADALKEPAPGLRLKPKAP